MPLKQPRAVCRCRACFVAQAATKDQLLLTTGAPRVIVGKSRPVWPGFAGHSYPQWGLGSRARTADAPPGRAERSSTKPPRVARSPRPVPEVAAQSPGRPAVPPCSVQMPPSLLPFSGLTASSGRLHCLASAGANQPAQVWARGPSRARRRPNEPRNPGFHLRSSTESLTTWRTPKQERRPCR